MNKILISDPNDIANLTKEVTGIIIGLKDFSYGFKSYYTPSDIAKLKTSKEIFVQLNKLIHNKDLKTLEEDLKALESLHIKGLIFDDMAILTMVKKLNINLNLIWGGNHLVNNYQTINYYHTLGLEAVLLSNELSVEEIRKIREKTKSTLFLMVYGYPNISYTPRLLLTNYGQAIDKEIVEGNYYLKDDKTEDKMPIIQDNAGTYIYASHLNDFAGDIDTLKMDYIIFNNYLLSDEDLTQALGGVL